MRHDGFRSRAADVEKVGPLPQIIGGGALAGQAKQALRLDRTADGDADFPSAFVRSSRGRSRVRRRG